MDNMDIELNNSFLEELNSTLAIKTDYDSKEYNYTWIEIFEDVIPYIDNILRNPKRFIINEEEVELTISKLKQKEDRDLKEEYILFELDKKSLRLGIQRLNNDIKKDVEENRKNDLQGYEKCINTRNRF